jgi:hypothetical protein
VTDCIETLNELTVANIMKIMAEHDCEMHGGKGLCNKIDDYEDRQKELGRALSKSCQLSPEFVITFT